MKLKRIINKELVIIAVAAEVTENGKKLTIEIMRCVM